MTSLRTVFAGTALALALASIGASAAQAQTTIRIANMGEPTSLDPHDVSGTWENRPVGELLMGLLTEDKEGKAIPGAAESWTISDDGLTYTFKLRQGATWSDGQPVTAEDFVYAYRRILDPARAAKYASIMYPIKNAAALNSKKMEGMENLGVKAIDANTLQITLENPTPFFLELLTHYTAWPVPKHAVEKLGKDWVKPGNYVGNGPYVLKEWTPQTQIVMEKNPRFFDAANVKIDRVVFIPNEDRSAVVRQFRAGEIDYAADFPSDQIDTLRQTLPKETRIAPYLGIYYFTINTTKKPFDDVRVRQALALAVDRQTITDKVIKTGEIPAVSFVPPNVPNYGQPAEVPGFRDSQADREKKAAELLKAAGYGPDKPLKVQLSYNTSENHRRIVVALAQMWKKLGVEAELSNSEVAVHYENLRQGNYEIGRAAWIADYPDAQNFLFLYEQSNQQNYARFKDPKFEELMQQAAKTRDMEARAKILREAESIALGAYANIPIYYYVSKNLVSQKLDGWVDNTRDVHRVRWMSLR
ncbi:MAG TPA: peptide ABC transporter substrate-binding protein [Azospirillaceae bacterium]|nr:peptide ABC transporter substrate-binding protein [Azospirillaceae bacterium]